MESFMMLCTFRPGTVMADVFAVVAEEQAAVAALEAEGRMGMIRLSLDRGTVFLEVFAPDADAATETVRTLPMSKWWDIDVFPITNPARPGGAA